MNPIKLIAFSSVFFLINCHALQKSECINSCNCVSGCSYCKENGITKICLTGGDLRLLGQHYGSVLKEELKTSLQVLRDYYKQTAHVGENELRKEAEKFQRRYTYSYTDFLKGMADSSGLTFDQVVILNAMETLGSLKQKTSDQPSEPRFGCMFGYVPADRTTSGGPIIVRNYDYGKPFERIANNLVVTIIRQPNKISTGLIGMPGQIYCPSCFNAAGLFLELNNGGPSGGFQTQMNRTSMLINMVEFMQKSATADQLHCQLNAVESDYSLILNSADRNGNSVMSYEYSSTMGLKVVKVPSERPFVSTNFYQSPDWLGSIPEPSDMNSFMGVTRRRNIMRILESKRDHNVESLKKDMDRSLLQGGAKWLTTIYQIIFDPQNDRLSIRSLARRQWVDYLLK